jgi:TolA-binding protein
MSYRNGAVIYFQGDIADKIYILQKGSVRVAYQNIETGSDEYEILQPGEVFGVKSALGRYNREENAIAIQDSMIMAMSVGEFEQFAMANTRIVMKMLKVFSNQLRRVHWQVTSLMVKEDHPNPEPGLFKIGEYYLKNKRYAQARYVFSRYLTYYPSGANAAAATEGLEAAEAALPPEASPRSSAGTGFVVGSGGSFAVGTPDSVSSAKGPQRGAEKKSLGLGKASAGSPSGHFDPAQAYNKAVTFISQDKYQEAYTVLRAIIDSGADREYTAKSSFDLGRCLFFMGKFNECIEHLSRVISSYPKYPELGGGLFFLGQAYEKTGRREQAAAFYKKILNLIPNPENEVRAKAEQALKGMEV